MNNEEQIKCKYKLHDDYHFNGKPYCTCFNELCEDISIICDHNCQIYEDYKQLIRKTQECEKLREANDEKNKFLQDIGISAGGEFKRIKFYIENLKNKYNEKAEECEELISEKDFYLQKIAVLEQECEELKEKLRELELKNTTLQNRNQQLDGSMAKADRYRKALDKIKYEATEEMKDLEADTDAYGCFKEILNIINKAKGEGK